MKCMYCRTAVTSVTLLISVNIDQIIMLHLQTKSFSVFSAKMPNKTDEMTYLVE